MQSKYDRVDVPDNLFLHSEGETEDFGTGVYPISVISRKSNFKNDTVKVACFKMRRKSRCHLMIGGLLFLLVLVLIIVIATKHNDATSKADIQTKGLMFEPLIDHIPFIKYSIADMKTYSKYIDKLQYYVYEYQSVHQPDSTYVDCTNGSAPAGKACRLTYSDFGSHCTHNNVYGYSQGRPCVLLRLKLDDNAVIDPFTTADTQIINMLNGTGRSWADNHVGVTCDGETESDRKAMGKASNYYEDGIKEYVMTYHPPTGFPVWFYPKKNEHYKIPAVMVHFNTIHTFHLVTIKCTAWAKNFNGGKPQDSNVYSTRFQIYME